MPIAKPTGGGQVGKTPQKIYCCDCGKIVAPDGRCAEHPNAKRYRQGFASKWFAEIRSQVSEVVNHGQVSRDGGYWGELDRRAAKGGL